MNELNEEELRKVCKCSSCGKGVMNSGFPTFYVFKSSRYFIKMSAVQRQAGLEQFMGGSVALARVFSDGADMAERIGEEIEITLCESCIQKDHLIGLMCLLEPKED